MSPGTERGDLSLVSQMYKPLHYGLSTTVNKSRTISLVASKTYPSGTALYDSKFNTGPWLHHFTFIF